VVGNACEPDGRIEGEIWQEAQGGGVADHPRNRKGLISDRRIKKQAFFVLQRYYREIGEASESRE
jgi:hypothetical protein